MKKTILKRSVASTLSFLMAFSTAVPNSVVYAEESGIESEIAQDYAATLSQTQNGTTSFVTDGNKTKGPTTHVQGDKVEVAVEPDEGFNTAKIEVKNTDGTVVASLEDGKVTANDKGNYTFEMPASDVTIGVSFEAAKKEMADAETETTGSETEAEKKETEEVKEEVKANIFDEFNKDSLVSKEVVDQYDFSSREIIIATEKADTIVDKDDIVDSGNGMYVLRYATVEHAKNAYSYYYGKVDFVAPNIVVHAAEGETSEDAGLANVGAPLDTLEQLGDAKKNASGTVIAVVDSGMPSNDNVTNRVSVINGGTEVGDDNGHGTKTMDAILSVNPDAKILSIKALDANGHGDAASIYAGIEYAKNSGAKIIVLPLYAYSVGENAALSTVIDEAIAKGITVVGAAGNDGANVKYYVPGNIDAAYIVGAANENGEKIASSNYGSTVDYNVIAESTSEASAKFAGFLSTVKGSYPAALEKAADKQTLIFRTDEVKKPEEEKAGTETADEVIAKYEADLSKKAIVRYTFVDESLLVSSDNWDSIMNGDREKIITTTLAETNLYKAEDGTYRFNANTPWANGVASGKVVDYVFAKGNDNGEFVTEGVSFNKDTHVATVTEAALKAAEGDFSNIQMQVIVPTNLSKTSNIGLTIESKNNDPVNTEFTASLFDYPSFAMHLKGTKGTLSKDDLTVYVNGEKTSKDGFEFNSESNIVTVKSYAIGISKIRVVIDKDVKVTFDKAIADGAISIPNAVAFYLKDGTNVDSLVPGSETTVNAVFGRNGYPAWPESNSKLGAEYIGMVQSNTSGDQSAEVLGYLGFPKNLFGINFQFYNSSGSSMGSWVDGIRGEKSNSNIGIAAYCVHEMTAIQPGADKETKFKIINKYKVGSETEFVMAYETTTGASQAGYGASQNLGGVIKFRVKDNRTWVGAYKQDGDGNYISGIKMAFYNYTGSKPSYSDLTSSVGKAKTSNLPSGVTYIGTGTTDSSGKTYVETTGKTGNFCVIETDVPAEYTINTEVFDATNNKWSSSMTTSNSPTIKNNSPHVKIVKKSSNEAITNDNACYSLEGTTYELRNGSTVVATFTLDANGNSTSKAVPAGTYTLVETKAGKGYKLSDPTTVTVNQTEKDQTFNVTDEPGGDPFVMSMAKVPLNGGTGNYPSTAGAEFTVKYYDGFYSSKAELPSTPKYTWTYVSKSYTGTKLSKETSIVSFRNVDYLKADSSRDGLMISDTGMVDIPYGTITIEETKSPASYLLNPSYVDADGNARNELILNINYDDNNAITFAGTNTSATKIQGGLEADSITTLAKESMIPVIETSLTADNGKHFTEAKSEVRLVDGVTLKNCESLAVLKKEIRVTGQLHDVETGELVTLENGKTSVTTVLTVKDKTEKIDNAFVFDASKYKGHTLVATEVVTMDGKELVKHDNLKDEAQMVHFPKIGTTNLSQESQRHIASIYGDIVLEDTVQYENLQPNTTYTVNGKLMNQKTGKPVLDENGKEVTASTTFTTGAATDDNGQTLTGYNEHSVPQYSGEHKLTVSGTTKVTFKFKSSKTAKEAAQKYVAYENIPGYATHADINDEAQTVYFPHVDTIASNNKNNSSSNYHGHNTIAMELTSDVKIKDKVVVTGVSPDAGTLRLDAYLYDVKTGKQLYNADGTPVTGTKTFTADNDGNATETVYFNTIDAKNLQFKDGTKYNAEGKKVVVYEYLYSENVGVGLEAELTSTDQSVIFPEVHTTATEQKLSNKGDHYLPAYDKESNTAYIQDVVEYKNLLPHTTYHVRGILMDKATGKPLLANGKEIVSEKDFTTGAATTDRGLVDGNVTVYFQVPASLMKGKTTVAFETITLDGLEVISHADINDQSQTDYFPGGHTTLTANDTGKHYSKAEEKIKITDVVSYENLKPETKYTVEGRLMRAAEDGETPDVYDENGVGAMYLVDGDGNFVKTVTDFTTPKAKDGEQSVSGTVDVKFTANAANLAGRTIVAFETLNRDGRIVFVHEDIKDEAQSIHFPEIDTIATYEDDTKGMHVVENAVIKDQVKLFNISPDAGNVKLTATLYDKETGEQILDAFGNPITGTKTFTAVGDATETVEIAFNAKNLTTKSGKYVADGRTVVVYESLTFDNNGVREHEDLTDIDQAVKFPSAHTTATDEETKDHYAPSVGVREIKDVVDFTGLLPDKTYHIKGELKNKKTGEAITDNDGNPIAVEGDFVTTNGDPVKEVKRGEDVIGSIGPVKITNNTPFDSDTDFMDAETFNGDKNVEKYDGAITAGVNVSKKHLVDGNVTVAFNVPTEKLQGVTTVAFETISIDGLEVITHANINDEAQTDYFPGGHTTLTDSETEEHIANADKSVKLADVVSYTNMKPETEFTVTGTLMDRATKKAVVDADGKKVTSTVKFTTPAAAEGEKTVSGEVKVVFEFNASSLKNHTVVAFEKMWRNDLDTDVLMWQHEDYNDKAQTVHFPEGKTTIKDNDTGNHITSEVLKEIALVDHVYYSNLLPGKEYTVNGTLMDKETGKPLVDKDGKKVTASTTFTAPAAEDGKDSVSGVVDVTFKFKGGDYLAGKTLVAFETCQYKGKDVFVHEEINDVPQTTYVPGGKTNLTDNTTKDHIVKAAKKMSLTDTVSYENLKSGETYKVTGVLMDKDTGKEFLVNGKKVEATKEFTIDPKPIVDVNGNEVKDQDGNTMMAPVSGSIDLTFEFEGSDELKGKTLVAFETMTYKDVEIFAHKDLKDEEQTVHIPDGHTSAVDTDTKDHIANADKDVTLIDTVTYSNVLAGKEYTVNGTLMDKKTGEPLLVGGKKVTASTTFTAPTPEDGAKYVSGTVDVTFKFDGSSLANKTVVVFEDMIYKGNSVFTHADINDKEQTVHFPEGKTTIKDNDTGNHITSEVLKEIALVDHVYYSNLLPGKEYTVNGTLMDKETGKPLVDKDGKKVTASTTFTAPAAEDGKDSVSGVVDVTFKFKGGDYLAGKTLVAFETCQYKGKDVFVHEEINDVPQTTYVPGGHTTFVDNATKDHIAGITEKMSLTDTVYYENLKSGETYKVTGVLMGKETGKPLLINGKKVEVTKEFTIDPKPIVDEKGNEIKDQDGNTMMAPVSGNIDLTFEFEGSDELKGKTLVAFETMTYKDVEIFVHKDLKDEEQTVHIPDGHTNVVDKDTKDRISKADKEVTLIDTVTYSNVLAGKEYEVTGTLMNKETGEPILVDGKEVKSTVKFTAPTPEDGSKYVSGTVDVTFKFDGSALAGKAVVAFEKVTYKGITVFTHADINDNDQTDYFPDGHTTITDNNTKDQITYAQGEISITDTVHYEGLLAEREYEVTGVLYDKKTGKPLKVDGKEVTASTKFTTPAAKEGKETVDGTVDVTFKFAGSKGLEDSEFVAFETVKRNGAEVFVHTDIDDVAQTVTVPGGKTTATDSETKNHTSYADKDVTIVDRVEYEGLLPEKEYKVEGKLMNKETGKPILVDGKEVTATAKFKTPKAEDEGFRVSGSVDVTFKFDGRALAGTATVVFEDVYYNGVKVFTHTDLEDEAQTVEFPSVKTSVKDAADNDRKITAKGTATMIDTVTYTNLVPGKSYTLKGVIMNKATGKPLTIDDKEVTASTTFVPEKKNGAAEVTFKFDASKVKPGNYVVFETMMETETKVVIGSHEDLDDKDQTFIVEAIPDHPKTGDRTNIFGWGALAFGSLAVGLSLVFKRKKKEEDAQ